MRAQVVLLQDNRILLARHERRGRPYWVLPGGTIEAGESPEQAAIRELREEAGLDVCIERLLFVEEPEDGAAGPVSRRRYTFLARRMSGDLLALPDPDGGHPEKGYLCECEWVHFDDPRLDALTRNTLGAVLSVLGQADAPA